MRWIDIARALCVLAVVVMHTTISLLVVVDHTQVDVGWRQIVDAMTPFRMPALALLSGMLLARRIRSGWADRSARASVALSYWLYVVWLLVFLLVAVGVGWSVWLGPLGAGSPLQGAQTFVDQLVLPRTILWYVMALAIWTGILTLIHRVPPAAVLITLSALSVASFYLPGDGSDQYRNVLRYFIFFAVGAYFSTSLRVWLTRRLPTTAFFAVAAFALVVFIAQFGSDENVDRVLALPRDIAGAVIVMGIAIGLSHIPGLGHALAWTGRRTLPIYVMHVPLLDMLTLFPDWWIGAVEHEAAHAAAPLVIALAIAIASVGFHSVATLTPARVLFALPRTWRARIVA